MTLIETLKQYETLSPFGDQWWIRRHSTPKYAFHSFVRELPANEMLFQVTIRGDIPEKLLHGLLTFLDDKQDMALVSTPITIFSAQIGAFTRVCGINSECHDAFRTFSEDLNRRTIVIFPSFQCEFQGDEHPELIRSMRKDIVCTVDWIRSPSPKIFLRYENYTLDLGPGGPQTKLENFDTLRDVIEGLDEANGFVEIESYRHELVKIDSSKIGFVIRDIAHPKKKNKAETLAWIKKFVF